MPRVLRKPHTRIGGSLLEVVVPQLDALLRRLLVHMICHRACVRAFNCGWYLVVVVVWGGVVGGDGVVVASRHVASLRPSTAAPAPAYPANNRSANNPRAQRAHVTADGGRLAKCSTAERMIRQHSERVWSDVVCQFRGWWWVHRALLGVAACRRFGVGEDTHSTEMFTNKTQHTHRHTSGNRRPASFAVESAQMHTHTKSH